MDLLPSFSPLRGAVSAAGGAALRPVGRGFRSIGGHVLGSRSVKLAQRLGFCPTNRYCAHAEVEHSIKKERTQGRNANVVTRSWPRRKAINPKAQFRARRPPRKAVRWVAQLLEASDACRCSTGASQNVANGADQHGAGGVHCHHRSVSRFAQCAKSPSLLIHSPIVI
jgi:hypothetical protein